MNGRFYDQVVTDYCVQFVVKRRDLTVKMTYFSSS